MWGGNRCLRWAHKSLRKESFQHFLSLSPNLPGTLCYVRASVLIFFQLRVDWNKSKLHSLANFLLVSENFSESGDGQIHEGTGRRQETALRDKRSKMGLIS